jgi:nucleoside-diphosphate-sugar epimerase
MTRGRVLLTGATGLIGRHCTAPLTALGYEVVALSRGGAPVAGATSLAANLLDPQAMARAISAAEADHLLHLAWHDGTGDRWTSPANLDWAAATMMLTRAFAAAGGRRAVLAGSCAEYDWSVPVLHEDTPLNPSSLYGSTKAATGIALGAAAPALGLSLAWARPFFCYGPGEPEGRLMGDLIKGLAAGREVPCTDGLQKRDFLHTADIGRALAEILASEVTGAINVGSGEATPVRDLIGAVARAMGREDLIRLGARPRPRDDPAEIRADVMRLRDEVGFRPAYDIAAGVADVLRAEAVLA